MHLTDLPLVHGKPPACVVEGRFSLAAPHDLGGAWTRVEDTRIVLDLRGVLGANLRRSVLRPDISGVLYPDHDRAHGFSLQLPAAINLEELLREMCQSPVDTGHRQIQGARFHAHGALGMASGWIPILDIAARVLETGLGVSFSGDVDGVTAYGQGRLSEAEPPLADSRVEADIVIPWTYLALLGSPLAFLGITPEIRDERATQRFNFNRPGLAGLALDRSFDIAYFQGELRVRPIPRKAPICYPVFDPEHSARPCVAARITDTELELTPTTTPFVYANGFTTGEYGKGPKLNLFGMGYDAWIKALSGEMTGRLEIRGDCVGFLTEAWTGGAVAGRHAVTACSLDLALDDYELVVTLQGEIDRLLTFTGPPLPPKLGTGFSVTMHIPRLFFTLRGVDLLEWGKQEHRLLEGIGYH
jgi:hypothetical protein